MDRHAPSRQLIAPLELCVCRHPLPAAGERWSPGPSEVPLSSAGRSSWQRYLQTNDNGICSPLETALERCSLESLDCYVYFFFFHDCFFKGGSSVLFSNILGLYKAAVLIVAMFCVTAGLLVCHNRLNSLLHVYAFYVN